MYQTFWRIVAIATLYRSKCWGKDTKRLGEIQIVNTKVYNVKINEAITEKLDNTSM